ncbi:hypothetical protein D5282_26450 [bacterium 1xD8-48]|nr:hypothetical protein [bacterium 1xD8-48]
MSAAKNTVMLKPDSKKMLVAMAEAELQPKELAEKSGVPVNIVYIARRGYYVKPVYLGKISKVLQVRVADLIEDNENVPEQAAAT